MDTPIRVGDTVTVVEQQVDREPGWQHIVVGRITWVDKTPGSSINLMEVTSMRSQHVDAPAFGRNLPVQRGSLRAFSIADIESVIPNDSERKSS